MKTISIFRKTDLGKETISLKLCIVGEAWLNNSLFLIVDPHIDIDEFQYARDRAMVFQENNYYTVFGKIDVNGRNCLVVKPKKTLENVVLSPQELLSERELQIVELVAHGKSNKQIAKKLKISEWTVSTHLRRVFVKLKVDSRAAMVYHCASLVRSRMETTQQKNVFAHLLPPN
jgi:DNA-binding CsgD family transcriptional regulator